MAMTICSECGNQVSDKAASCPHCGAPVLPVQQPVAAPQPQFAQQPATSTQPQPQYEQPQPQYEQPQTQYAQQQTQYSQPQPQYAQPLPQYAPSGKYIRKGKYLLTYSESVLGLLTAIVTFAYAVLAIVWCILAFSPYNIVCAIVAIVGGVFALMYTNWSYIMLIAAAGFDILLNLVTSQDWEYMNGLGIAMTVMNLVLAAGVMVLSILMLTKITPGTQGPRSAQM